MYYDFVSKVMNILFLCGVVALMNLSLNKKYSRYILGVMFGLITIFIMNDKFMVDNSYIYDFRHISMTMAGFIGGPVTAVIATIISSLYWYHMGVSGSMYGITVIIVFACFGCLLGKHFKSSQNERKLLIWFIIGIVMACIMLVIVALILSWKNDLEAAPRAVSGPFLLITPLATTLILNFYFRCTEFFSNALIVKTIINFSPINLVIFDAHGPILISKYLQMLRQSSQKIEDLFKLQDTDKTWLNTTKQQHIEIVIEDERHFVGDLSSFEMPSGEYACVAVIHDLTDRKREQESLRSANDRFAKAFELGPHMMAIIRKSDYKYIDVNRRYLAAGGFEYEDVIGKTPIEIGVSENQFNKVMAILREKGAIHNVEDTIVTKNGLPGTVLFSAEEIQIDNQECILLAYNNITEMKRMQMELVEQLTKHLELEAELSRSNQLIADIINNMPDAFYVLDNQWRFTFVNKKTEGLFQKTREELLGKVLWEIYPQTRGCLLELNFQKAKNDWLPITFEIRCLLNRDLWIQVTAYPSQFGLSVYYMDITKIKLAHDKLIKSQDEMVSILESMTDCFYAMDGDLRFTYINHAAEIAFEKSRDQLLGKKMTEVFKANDTALLHYHAVMREKKSVTFEIISEALGGKWLEISVYPKETGVTCYFRNITSRKAAEETIRQSEEKFSKAFHGGPIMMTLATVEGGKFIDANDALCSGIGYNREEIIGRTSKELNFFVDMDMRQERGKMLIEQGRIENVEVDFRTKSGEIRHGLSWSQLCYLDGQPCHITGLIDVTEQKRTQEEMAKLDRLNLVGQLAAGIAHEIRNPMTTVRGYLQLLSTKANFAAQQSTFELMISEVDRANGIITEFLSLAQTKPTELKSQNLNDIIKNLYPLLEADTFTQNKQIYFIPEEIPNLALDGKEISQLVLNLTRNGLDAMEESGCLTIRTYVKDSTVVLAIEDKGCGIPAENMSKIGTPFFTNKDNGTGLGLATCFKIAESHQAKVHINSSPNGTTFFILFPIPDQQNEMIL